MDNAPHHGFKWSDPGIQSTDVVEVQKVVDALEENWWDRQAESADEDFAGFRSEERLDLHPSDDVVE